MASNFRDQLWQQYNGNGFKNPLIRDFAAGMSRHEFDKALDQMARKPRVADLATDPEKHRANIQELSQASPEERKSAMSFKTIMAAQRHGTNPEAPRRAKSEGGLLDKVQMGLDAIGVADPTPITDTANAILSIGRAALDKERRKEHLANAGISLVSGFLPYAGDTAKVAKYGRLGYRATKAKVASQATKTVATSGTEAVARQEIRQTKEEVRRFGEPIANALGGGGAGGGGGGPLYPPPTPDNDRPRFGDPPIQHQQQSERDARAEAEGVGLWDRFNGKLREGAEKVGGLAVKAYLAIEGLSLLNRGVLALNRDLREYSGELAASYAEAEHEQIKRNINRASRVGGALGNLQREQDRFDANMLPLRSLLETTALQLQTFATRGVNYMVESALRETGIQKGIDGIQTLIGGEIAKSPPGAKEILSDLRDGKFDGYGLDSLGERFEVLDKETRNQMNLPDYDRRARGRRRAP